MVDIAAVSVLHNIVVALVVALVPLPNMEQVCPVSVQLRGLLSVVVIEVYVTVYNREIFL